MLPNGLAADHSSPSSGSVADIEVLRDNVEWHGTAFKSFTDSVTLTDNEEFTVQYSLNWEVLLDKCYTGI